MSSEQRRYPRYGVHLAVRYTNAEEFVADYLENLSVGGLFIAVTLLLPRGIVGTWEWWHARRAEKRDVTPIAAEVPHAAE